MLLEKLDIFKTINLNQSLTHILLNDGAQVTCQHYVYKGDWKNEFLASICEGLVMWEMPKPRKEVLKHLQFSSVQSLSRVQLFATPRIAAHKASLSITSSRSSPKLMSIKSVMPSSHLILGRPLLLLPPIPPIKVFSNESTLRMRWPKYWSFRFSINPANEYLRLISFRIDWFDFLAVQKTLKSLLQHDSSKALILGRCSIMII